MFQLAGGTLRSHHVARPLTKLLPRAIRFAHATVRAIHLELRQVETNVGTFPYDFLVVALGGVPNFYGITSAAQYALPFKWLPDVGRLRAHIARQFADAERTPHRAADLLRFVITGAGCTGVELIAELHDWMRGPLLRQHAGVRDETVRLVLAEALGHLLCPMEPRLMRAALRKLLSRTIDVRLGTSVTAVGPTWIRLRPPHGDEIQIPCGAVVWTAGVQAPPLVAELPVPHGPAERVQVSPTLQIPGFPEVLAVGDLAACPDPPGTYLPATAQVAVQQGPHGSAG
jgi:NADH dehydrogenase